MNCRQFVDSASRHATSRRNMQQAAKKLNMFNFVQQVDRRDFLSTQHANCCMFVQHVAQTCNLLHMQKLHVWTGFKVHFILKLTESERNDAISAYDVEWVVEKAFRTELLRQLPVIRVHVSAVQVHCYLYYNVIDTDADELNCIHFVHLQVNCVDRQDRLRCIHQRSYSTSSRVSTEMGDSSQVYPSVDRHNNYWIRNCTVSLFVVIIIIIIRIIIRIRIVRIILKLV